MLWRLGRGLRRKTTLAGLAGGVLTLFCLGLLWIGWVLPSLSGPRTGGEGLDLLRALQDIAPIEGHAAEGARLHRQVLGGLPADMAWDWQLFWMEGVSLGLLSIGLFSFYALLPRLYGAAFLVPVAGLLLFPSTGFNVLEPQTGASVGVGLLLFSAMLAPHLRLVRLLVASGLTLVVHPAAWGFGVVGLLLILQRWVDGRIAGRRATAELAVMSIGTVGLAAFLERASLAVAPIFPRPEIDLSALGMILREVPDWAAGLALTDAFPLVLALIGLLQILRHGERVHGFQSVVVIVLLVIPLVAGVSVGGKVGQAVYALLLTVPFLTIPGLFVAENVPSTDARRGRGMAIVVGLGAIVIVQSAVQLRDAHWPDPNLAGLSDALALVGSDTDIEIGPNAAAAHLSGWRGTSVQGAEVALVKLPGFLNTSTGLSRDVFRASPPGFDLRDMGLLRVSLPDNAQSVYVQWTAGNFLAAIGPNPCAVVETAGSWYRVDLSSCGSAAILPEVDITGDGVVTGLLLDGGDEVVTWPWGRSDVAFSYASGSNWRRSLIRGRGDFGWAALGLEDGAQAEVLSDQAGYVMLRK